MSSLIATIIAIARGHEALAYAVVAILAMSEAIPIVGVFVPGTAIILGISALIPTGAVGIWPMVISATLGAIVGDGLSYWAGHRYHRAITSRWPLSRYPALISRGEAFFRRHGGKSVFIARFSPGVRAVVPMVAGILLMSPFRFYVMNVLSAVVWAPSHVLIGALIGASLTLLGAVAGRLAAFVVILIAALWFVGSATRYAIRHLPALLVRLQGRVWRWAQARDTWLSNRLLSVLDPTRKEMPGLALLGALLIGGLWLFLGVLQDVLSGDPLIRADTAIYHFLQSLRTAWGDRLMVAVTELGDARVTLAVVVMAVLWLAWRRAWRAAAYMTAAVAMAGLFTFLLKVTIHLPRPISIASGWNAFTFPSGHTTVTAALYGFLAMLVAWELSTRWRLLMALFASLLVASIAFSRLYLGAHWISDVLAGLAFGVAWAALLGIAYFRRNPPPVGAAGLAIAAASTLLIAGAVHIDRYHAADTARYAVRERSRVMDLKSWWTTGWSDLPVRRLDLLGEFEQPFTIQWAGRLDALKTELAVTGWVVPVPWTVQSALAFLTPHARLSNLPVLPRLDSGREEHLIMIFPLKGEAPAGRLVLRLWRSGTVLGGIGGSPQPLWIGTVVEERIRRFPPFMTLIHETPNVNVPLAIAASALETKRLVKRTMMPLSPFWNGTVVLSGDFGRRAQNRQGSF